MGNKTHISRRYLKTESSKDVGMEQVIGSHSIIGTSEDLAMCRQSPHKRRSLSEFLTPRSKGNVDVSRRR